MDCPHYSSELTKQPHVNKRAGGHPTLVWDVYQRHEGGEMIARCLPVTSFGTHGGSIEEKYDGSTSGRSAWKHIPRYLPIDHNGETGSKFNVPVLRLIDGRSMAKQSYVHLDHFYEVEARFLLEDKHRGLRLEYESLCIAAGKLMDFCDGMIYRIRWAPGETAPKSPLDVAYGGCGRPRDLGRPARALVSDGHMHEGHRLRETRTERVTGWEHSKPAPQDPRAPRWFPRRRRAR